MCGICGYISTNLITKEQLTVMNDSMFHRGPDDSGVELYDARSGFTVGLAQRRLSILDLSPLGHQPMDSEGGRLSIVYNGEIYNFGEIKKELSDYPFKSTCDTEVILAAYLKWGEKCLDKMDGMFALAIYDREKKEIFFARDRIGKKPLYYWLSGDTLVFASELKPIMLCPGFERMINRKVLSRYLYQQCIDAPDTIFEHVYKLAPGATMKVSLEGAGTLEDRTSVSRYWSVADAYKRGIAAPVTDYFTAKHEMKELLRRATADRMIADVPLGSFLSGGYDSSLISAIAQEQCSSPLKTFSIGFSEKEYDEAVFAKKVAEHLGTDHTELYIDEAQMYDLVDSIPEYFDEPFADSSEIPTMLVSMLARKKVTVVLSGDGGDEFYCGYNIYKTVAEAQKLDGVGAAAHFFGQIPVGHGKNLESRYPFKARVVAANRDPETKTQFGAGTYVESALRMVADNEDHIPVNFPSESIYGTDNWQVRRMLLDMDHYLPGDILCKVDRASMKYSLETRCPILDRDVMEHSFRIPHEFKYMDAATVQKILKEQAAAGTGTGAASAVAKAGNEGFHLTANDAAGGQIKKAILKDIAYDYIPRDLLDRPKKGFGVPLDKWLRGPLRDKLTAYSDHKFLEEQGLFDADYTSGLIADYLVNGDGGPATGANFSKICWSFFVFQQWYEKSGRLC